MTQDAFGQFEDARVRARSGIMYQAIDGSQGLLMTIDNDGMSSMLIRCDSPVGFIDYAISKCGGSLDPPAGTRISE